MSENLGIPISEEAKYHCPVHGDIGNSVMNLTVHGCKGRDFCWRCIFDYAENALPAIVKMDDK